MFENLLFDVAMATVFVIVISACLWVLWFASQCAFADRTPPRLTGWSLLAVTLLAAIGLIAPQQLPVVLYKLALVIMGCIVGYWLDRALFPYARPHNQHNVAAAPAQSLACLRRALVVIACVLGLTMGL